MPELQDFEHIGRSSWHLLVSIQRFSYTTREDGVVQRKKCDFVRPLIAMVSTESAETLWQATYGMKCLVAFKEYEEAGVAAARYPFLAFDLDGLSSNIGMVACRRKEIIDVTKKIPAVSCRHCGNHCENLVEKYTLDAVDDETINFMTVAVVFFQTAANFLRLLHALPGYLLLMGSSQ